MYHQILLINGKDGNSVLFFNESYMDSGKREDIEKKCHLLERSSGSDYYSIDVDAIPEKPSKKRSDYFSESRIIAEFCQEGGDRDSVEINLCEYFSFGNFDDDEMINEILFVIKSGTMEEEYERWLSVVDEMLGFYSDHPVIKGFLSENELISVSLLDNDFCTIVEDLENQRFSKSEKFSVSLNKYEANAIAQVLEYMEEDRDEFDFLFTFKDRLNDSQLNDLIKKVSVTEK